MTHGTYVSGSAGMVTALELRPARRSPAVAAAAVTERPRPSPRPHSGPGERWRRPVRGPFPGRPPVAAGLVGEGGDGGLDASREPGGVLAVRRDERRAERDLGRPRRRAL